MSKGEQAAARLERAVDAFVERVQQVPPNLLAVPPAEGEWTVLELAAHSAEIYGYWAKQIAWLRTHPEQPFGRTASDPDRIAFVEQHKTDSLPSLVELIRAGGAEAAAALRAYSDHEWATLGGFHSARGRMDVDFIADLFLAGHAEEHLKQLDDTLDAVQPG